MEQYLSNFKNCLQKEIPYCAAECPFHLDIHDFIEKMKRGGFRGAFKTYRDAAGFPRIASELCHEPCKGVCPRKGADSAIELLMLEKACISFTADRAPTDYNLPGKKKKVAVIGAGISGLACALRLCMKKYEVEIFEASGRIGGYLWELMKPEIFMADIEEQFKHEKYVIHLNTPVKSPEDLTGCGFDAVYAATGEGGTDFGLPSPGGRDGTEEYSISGTGRHCAFYGGAGWFAGGGLIGEQPVYALANGLYMGTVIDNFLKTGKLLNSANIQSTCIQLDPAKLKREETVLPANGMDYNEEEAKKEAARCLECQCDFCRTYCDLTDFYKKWPLRIRDEIMATTLPGSADVKATPAKRLLSTCSQCGLCKDVCPEEIDLGGLILEGRKSMHRQKKAPWVFHDFWLRDMDFANGDLAALTMPPAVGGSAAAKPVVGSSAADKPAECEYAFFPGCQLGASDPDLVKRAYAYLTGKRPDTGLILRCCGAPAEWSGDEERFKGEIEAIRRQWEALGKPKLILACPTCEKKFKAYMPDIPVTSVYEIIADWGIETGGPADNGGGSSQKPAKIWSVFDACAARHENGMKEAVRALAEKAGCRLEPLPLHDSFEQCCGFGGQPGAANPEYAEFVVQKRITECENPYITYCINCRDSFVHGGKEAVHILDLIFGIGNAPEKLATVSERRGNRIRLKRDLLKEYRNIETEEMKQPGRKVRISEELKEKLDRERILEEDAISVLDFCERTGRRVFLPEKGIYSGYREIGYTTYWVEYKLPRTTKADGTTGAETEAPTCELVNAYAHRMKIELEPVWNGKKMEQDL
jgi:Fe-S oxidoreductase